MAKGDHYTPYQQKVIGGYYEQRDTIFVSKLSAVVSDLYLSKNDKETGRLWAKAKEFLAKTTANPVRVTKLLSEKNLEELARVVNELSGAKTVVAPKSPSPDAPAATTPDAPAVPEAPTAAPAPETLKSALNAFRKRLKLTVLNDESRLSPRVMTGGKRSEIAAIVPPDQFPKEVWEELARQGKLRSAGGGFYQLVD